MTAQCACVRARVYVCVCACGGGGGGGASLPAMTGARGVAWRHAPGAHFPISFTHPSRTPHGRAPRNDRPLLIRFAWHTCGTYDKAGV